jgi:hypothetical protein
MKAKYFFRMEEIFPSFRELQEFKEAGGYIIPVMSATDFLNLREKIGHEKAIEKRDSEMMLICDNKQLAFDTAMRIRDYI